MNCMAETTEHALPREAPPGSFVEILYENGEGHATRRRVRIIRYSHAGNGLTYIRAYCFLRKEERTFREDRIREWKAGGVGGSADGPAIKQKPSIAWPPEVPKRDPPPIIPPYLRQYPISPWSEGSVGAGCVEGPRASPGKKKQRRWAERLKSFLWKVAVACIALFILGPRVMNRQSSGSVPAFTPLRIPVEAPRLTTPKPVKPPPAPTPPELPVRADRFRQATGIHDPGLENAYAAADNNHDGSLSWTELRNFQSGLKRKYEYLSNGVALRPDEFMERGGGDCDDWALFTCGLLRYWGWETYLGCFRDPRNPGNGHAVCLVRLSEAPGSLMYYAVDEDSFLLGGAARPGYYVPIDYDVVGGISNAMGKRWKLAAVYAPEEAYGSLM